MKKNYYVIQETRTKKYVSSTKDQPFILLDSFEKSRKFSTKLSAQTFYDSALNPQYFNIVKYERNR